MGPRRTGWSQEMMQGAGRGARDKERDEWGKHENKPVEKTTMEAWGKAGVPWGVANRVPFAKLFASELSNV